MMGGTTKVYNEKINLQVPIWLSFQGSPSFLAQVKSTKTS